MASSEIYQSQFLIRIPEDHPNYEARVQQILEIIRPFDLESLEVFWPVGLPVLPNPEPEFEVQKKWDLGKLSAAFQKKARGKLVAKFSMPHYATKALKALSATEDSTLGGKALPPQRRRPNVVTKPGHEKISGREVPPAILSEAAADPLWAKTLLKPPADWLNYALRNIAVIDSGCDTSHPTFLGYGKMASKSRVTCFGGAEDYGGHGSFVCGQLVGKGGVAELPANHGLLPKSHVWMGNVAVTGSDSFTYPADLGAYDLALNLLTMKGTPEYKAAGLDKFNIQVVNLSLGGENHCAVEEESINALHQAGISVVACVHNKDAEMEEWDAPVFFPAALSNAISVSAIEPGQGVWVRSRTLPVEGYERARLPFVDMSAPGVSILSSLPGGKSGWRMGTSFAAPLVTAALAVLRAAYPKLSVDQAAAKLFHHILQDDNFKSMGHGCGILQCSGLRVRTPPSGPWDHKGVGGSGKEIFNKKMR